MSLHRWFPPLAAALAVGAVAIVVPSGASAVELIEGGSGGASLLGADVATMTAADEAEDGTAVLLDFTPRGAGLVAGERAGAPRLRFELGVADPAAEEGVFGGQALGGDQGPSWLDEPGRDGERQLSLGGALSWSQWTVGGSVGRGGLLAGGADLVSAVVGYGPLTASLTYGQGDDAVAGAGSGAGDVLMLSTDLTAWSWLTLESDVAVRADQADDEQEAVGRLGVRLSF